MFLLFFVFFLAKKSRKNTHHDKKEEFFHDSNSATNTDPESDAKSATSASKLIPTANVIAGYTVRSVKA